MTAPLRTSQTSAPVNEFRCLFTHDLRRKQKRWQDGYLKFHTFNNRVMVYDQSRNFLGDTYWKETHELQEGEELQLDKPVMVEVAEAIGTTQTDLTPLFEKNKEATQQSKATPAPAPAPPSRPLPRTSNPQTSFLRGGSQLRHKSLNSLLGTSKGPIGKAKPIISPFQERQEREKENENHFAEERASKRQKTNQHPPQRRAHSPVARPQPRGNTAIDLTTEPDNFSFDVTLPSTPAPAVNHLRPNVTPAPRAATGNGERAQSFATPRIPKGKVPVPSVKALEALETPRQPPRSSSPPVSTSNRIMNVDFALQPAQSSPIQPVPPLDLEKPVGFEKHNDREPQNRPSPKPVSQSPPRKPKALRLSTGVKRGMLLCSAIPQRQNQAPKPKRTSEPKSVQRSKQKPRAETLNDPVIVVIDDNDMPPTKTAKPANFKIKTSREQDAQTLPPSSPASPKPYFAKSDDMETALGLMDQQLTITPSPPRPQPAKAKSPPVKKTASKRKSAQVEVTEGPPSKVKKTKSMAKEVFESPPHKEKQAGEVEPEQQYPPSSKDALEAPEEHPTTTIELHEPTIDGSRTISASLSVSPKKLPLSTSDFTKKPKGPQKKHNAQPAPASDITSLHETVALPSHPLRSSKAGPVMTTTELSAQLLNSPLKSIHPEDDPIEDDDEDTLYTSPNRAFRRTRSANDASSALSIPSTSKIWEEQNLPKKSKTSPTHNNPIRPAAPEAIPPSANPTCKSLPKLKLGGLAALVKKTDPRRKFQRTRSLNVSVNVNGGEYEVVSPLPVDDDVGPWSTEAFDLFDWRPPPVVEDGEVVAGTEVS